MKLQDLIFEQAFPPLYHGTASDRLVRSRHFNPGEVYLTTDEFQAPYYAYGLHLGGSTDDVKYVLTVQARSGKVYDGNDDVQSIVMEEHDRFDSIEQLIAQVRKQDFRYVTFMHPSFDQDQYHLVVISLYPNQDLRIIAVDKLD